MSTISTIGTSSRNYSTISAWAVAFTTGGWIGECYNDSEFNETVDLTYQSTSATNFLTLRTASGQGFKDNANAQTNALKYNQANGVAWKYNVSYGIPCDISVDYVTIQGLQIQQAHATGGRAVYNHFFNAGSPSNQVLDGVIVEQLSTTQNGMMWAAGTARNCLVIMRASASTHGVEFSYSGSPVLVNCTIVRPSDKSSTSDDVFHQSAGAVNATIKNCAGYGFSAFSSSSSFSGSNNSSDKTISFGTSNQASKTYANQFQTAADSTRDFRAQAGADILNNGVTDTTDIPAAVDIVGTSRPQGSAWDIGCWELIPAASLTLRNKLISINRAVSRASYW